VNTLLVATSAPGLALPATAADRRIHASLVQVTEHAALPLLSSAMQLFPSLLIPLTSAAVCRRSRAGSRQTASAHR